MFDPKKMMNDAMDQVQKQATDMVTGSTNGGSGSDELIYRMTRDMEDLRRKNQELSDKLNDFERQFIQLKDIINRK
jgi:archaellum component FlaC